jgi:hypothetical protein
VRRAPGVPTLVFVAVAEGKIVKYRLRLDARIRTELPAADDPPTTVTQQARRADADPQRMPV